MEYQNNSIPILKIEKDKYGKEYKWIESGSERKVYKYDENSRLKFLDSLNNQKTKIKTKKNRIINKA